MSRRNHQDRQDRGNHRTRQDPRNRRTRPDRGRAPGMGAGCAPLGIVAVLV
ncbi:hypothetical protein [Streptomyces cucumeris]|uniref:hypothetical protein n=1 Tax=Streptomyces cucumeris TaxID=2962890 RepID=UPI0020C86C48|nr:hypothetical protein [Streptomyces sp. NEAU-Y11]MCP9209913.1 hypothetical protein [Streptomyces sp. NEAU-Y11]